MCTRIVKSIPDMVTDFINSKDSGGINPLGRDTRRIRRNSGFRKGHGNKTQ